MYYFEFDFTFCKSQIIFPTPGNARAFQISRNFIFGEWSVVVTDGWSTFLTPSSTPLFHGSLQQFGNELRIFSSYGLYRGNFSIEPLPEMTAVTWTIGDLNGI